MIFHIREAAISMVQIKTRRGLNFSLVIFWYQLRLHSESILIGSCIVTPAAVTVEI